MCRECWEGQKSPRIINERTVECARSIAGIYQLPGGIVGGHAHIVVDDWNLNNADLDFCIGEIAKNTSVGVDQANLDIACLKCLNLMKKMTIPERYSAMALHSGYFKQEGLRW